MKAVTELTFEEAFFELEETVHQLEMGGLELEESLTLYARGQELAAHCNRQLEQATLKVQQLLKNGETAPLL